METQIFIDRIVEILRYMNSQQQAGENKITLTQEQFDTINATQDINTAQQYLLAYNIPPYIVSMALDENTSLEELGTYDASMAQAVAEFGMEQEGPSYLGVTSDYVSPRGEAATDYYTDSELITLFAGKSEEEIAGIQAQLINSGILEVDAEFLAGDWGRTTQRAMSYVLGTVNRRGVTEAEKLDGSEWRLALAEYELNPIDKYPEEGAYLPPDYQSVANTITGWFKRGLNRDPQPYEMKLLANTIYSESQQAYQQNVDLKQFAEQEEVSAGGLLAGEYGNYSKENVQSKIDEEGLTQIDPVAAGQFQFNKLIEDEKGRLGENLDTRKTRASILASLNQRPGFN